MAYDGSLKFDTKVDDKGFRKGMDALNRTAHGALKTVGKMAKITGAAVGAMGIASIKVGSDFEAGMSQVAATMGMTSESIQAGNKDFEMLKAAAKEAGATTQFSATEAAEALNYLALAGYDANQAVETMPKVLNLAAAGGLDLAYASDLVTDSMSALGLSIDDADRFIDQMAKTSQKSNTDVAQLGEAILVVGANARDLKNGTVELNTAIGLLANVGIKGAEGGTKLRNVIMAMTPTTDKAADAFKRLKVDTYDANGEMRGLDEIFQDLNKSMDGMSTEEKKRLMSDIFNKQDLAAASALLAANASNIDDVKFALEQAGVPSDKLKIDFKELAKNMDDFADETEFIEYAMKEFGMTAEQAGILLNGVNSIVNEGETAWKGLENEVKNSKGAAEEMSKVLLDNLKGSVTILGSSLEALGISIYDNIGAPVRSTVDLFTEYTDALNTVVKGNDGTAESLMELAKVSKRFGIEFTDMSTGIQGAAELVGYIVTDMVTKVANQIPKFVELGTSIILSFIDGIRSNAQQLGEIAAEIAASLINSFIIIIPELFATGIVLIQNFGRGMIEALPELIETAQESIMVLVITFIDSLPVILDIGVEIISMLILGIVEMIPNLIDTGVWLLLMLVDTIMENIPILLEVAVEIINTLVTGLTEALPQILEMALTIVVTLIEGIINNVDNLVEAAIGIVDALIAFITDNLDTIIEFTLKIIMAIVEGLINNLDKLIEAAIHLVTAIVEGLINNLPLLVEAAIKLVLGIVDGLIQALPQLVAAGVTLIMELIGTIVRLIPQLISVGLQLVGELIIGIIKAVPRVLKAGGSLIKAVIKGIKAGIKGIVGIGGDIVKGLWEGITGLGGWLYGKVRGFAKGVLSNMKSALGIRSPSKLFEDEIGKNLSLGIGVGFEEGLPDLNRDMEKEMAALTDKMKATVDLEAGSIGTRVSANSIGTASQTITVDTTNDNEKIDYDKLGEATVRAFVRSGIGISVNNREFGRLVADSLGERRG